MESLNCSERQRKKGHYVKRQRKNGIISGVIYGKGVKNLLFEIGAMEFNTFINKNGEHGILNLSMDGTNHKTLIKELQKDPVNHSIMHIDLEEISSNQKVQTEVPIHFIGEKILKKDGSIVQKERDSIKIECNSSNIPKFIDVNLQGLSRQGALKVRDIEISKDITVIDELNTVIASIIDTNTAPIEVSPPEEGTQPPEVSKIDRTAKNERSEE